MQKSDEISMSKSSHRKMQASTTLSRKYTKRPSMKSEIKIPKSLKISRFGSSEISSGQLTEASSQSMEMGSQMMEMDSQSMGMEGMMQDEMSMNGGAIYAPETVPVYPDYPEEQATSHPMQESANMSMQERAEIYQQPMQSKKMSHASTVSGVTAKEMKEQAIKKAMSSASKVSSTQSKKTKKTKRATGMHFGFGRVALALTCASVAVMAIIYFVNLNMPDISLSVAAMQNGMKVVYPSYIPRDYNVSSVMSEEGKVTMVFNNSTENKAFSLVEESSSWDSSALLTNYVKNEYGENYSVIKEQGLTLYVSGSNATWVNGGNLYKIIADNGTLTNKQIKSIAVSL